MFITIAFSGVLFRKCSQKTIVKNDKSELLDVLHKKSSRNKNTSPISSASSNTCANYFT